MNDFGQQAQEWSPFFGSVAQVSGALLGLVFLALTFNGKLSSGGNLALSQLARQTFADFLNVLVVSLMLLVPHTLAFNVGAFVGLFGIFGVARILRSIVGILRNDDERKLGRKLLQRFFLSLCGNIGLLISGILLLRHGELVTFWSTLFGSIIGLLISGARSAWMMVITEPGAA